MFNDRLKRLRESRGLTQKEISVQLEIPQRTYSSYENNEREPNSEILKRLSFFFGVTVDYLLGIETIHNIQFSSSENLHIIKYRELDIHGKDIVDTVLEKEHKRCIEQNSNAQDESDNTGTGKMLTAKIAAFGGDNSIKQISEEELLERFRKLRGK